MGSLLTMHRPSTTADPMDPREATLVDRARGGDVEAWSRLYQEHFAGIFRHVAYLSGDVHVAEDLAQETFAHAFVGLARFESRTSFVGWLRSIAVNLVRRHWRSRCRSDRAMTRLESMAHDPAPTASADPEGAHLRRRRAEVLLAVLETLPEALREAFVLCDMQDMPTAEAAAALGVTPVNLRVRATRARAKIRCELVRLGWLTDEGEEDGHAER